MNIAPFFLTAAQAGTSLLQAHYESKAIGEQTAEGIFQSKYAGLMERFQLKRQAQLESRARQEAFAQTQGAQRAALYAAGVGGGRTARLLEARSRTQYSRAQSEADISARMGTQASRTKRQREQSALRMGARQAIQQSSLDLFGNLLGSAQQVGQDYEAWEAGER